MYVNSVSRSMLGPKTLIRLVCIIGVELFSLENKCPHACFSFQLFRRTETNGVMININTWFWDSLCTVAKILIHQIVK